MKALILKAYVYKLTNKESGKVYVGQTTQNPKRRWRSSTGSSFKASCSSLNSLFISADFS